MNGIKVWPHMTIVAVVVALIAGFGVAFWLRSEESASAADLPYAARIQRVDGEVAFSDNLASNEANPEWVAATPNQPFSVGDRIYTRDNARTSVAFNGRNFARLDPNTSLDVVALDHHRTQLALREGSAIFDVGYLEDDELFEVATPNGAVNFDQPGLYNVGFDDNGGVLVSVLSGLAQVAGLGGSGEINKGEVLTLLGQTAAELVLSRINNDDAGYMVDDYYRYQYPNSYDGRYNSYDAYQNDPNYYDPYRRNTSYQYASSTIPGLQDLDYYGDWQNVDGYGQAWRPRVDSDWVPYQQGQWTNDYPYGPTWVSSEPWGYAPYHYGRWANVGNQWYWVPEAVNTKPAYAPALVAFVPVDADQIGWVPLGPGDAYAPRYYDQNWQPQYLTRAELSPAQLINLGIPGAVSVVPLDSFGRVIDRRQLRRIERDRQTSLRPTLDPLTLTPLRNAVVNSAWGRGKIDLPPGIAKKLHDTPVYFGREVRDSRFNRNLARSLRAERVSDKARGQKYKVRDAREDRGREREDQARGDQERGDQARGDQGRTDQDRGDRERGNQGRGDQGRGDQAQGQEVNPLNRVPVKGHRSKEERQNTEQPRNVTQDQTRDQAKPNPDQEQRNRAQQQQAERAQQQAQRDQQRSERAQRENQEKAQRKAQQQPQGQRVANPERTQQKSDRQQAQPRIEAPPKPKSDDGGGGGRGDGGKGKGKSKP